MESDHYITFTFPDTEKVVKIEKDVLCQSSPVFSTMLDDSFLDDGILEVTEFTPNTINNLMKCIIQLKPVFLEPDDAIKLYLAAHHFEVLSVENKLKKCFQLNLNATTLLKFLSAGLTYNIIFLVDACEQYFQRNTYSVMNEIVMQIHPITDELISHLLSLEDLNVIDEIELYQFLETLICQKRLQTYDLSIKQIRFTAMTEDKLASVQLLSMEEHMAKLTALSELNCFEDETIRLLQGGFRGKIFLPRDEILDESQETIKDDYEKAELEAEQVQHWRAMLQTKTNFSIIFRRLAFLMDIKDRVLNLDQ